MLNQIKSLADAHFADAVKIRRILHANPELAFEEYATAQLVKETLEPLGIPIQTNIAKTGVVATIEGKKPGKTFCLRADMDALPILEENTFDFVSKNTGKMHACGHDGHTASLLTTAKILHALRDDLHGTARLIFQPSEERIPGGAKFMIEEGVLEADALGKPDEIFGQHVAPDLPVGTIGVKSGMYMASADEIYMTVHGQGGHGAMPHKLAADPVLVAAHIVVALQSVIARNCPPDVPSVLTVGKIIAEGATNIIPNFVKMEGTFRAMNEEWRFRAHDLIRRVAENTALAFGATVEVNILVGYPYLYNDPQLTALVRDKAIEYVGAEKTIDLDLWFAAEDFAWYLQHIKGVFYRLGTGSDAANSWYGLHTPRFTLDEEALRVGSGFMAHLAISFQSGS